MGVAALHRNLEQELLSVLRGANLECPVCGEFVLHEARAIRCPECGMTFEREFGRSGTQLELQSQAG